MAITTVSATLPRKSCWKGSRRIFGHFCKRGVQTNRVAWTDEIEASIAFHHKITPFNGKDRMHCGSYYALSRVRDEDGIFERRL